VHTQVPIDDTKQAKIDAYFDDVCAAIHAQRQQGGKTLVHCAAGRVCLLALL
jgi:protein-tyrosine phosphatase